MKEVIIENKLMIDKAGNLLYYKKKENWKTKKISGFKEIHFTNSETLVSQISTLGKIVFSSFLCKKEGYLVAKINKCYYLYKLIKDNDIKYIQLSSCEKSFRLPCSKEVKDVSNLAVNGVCIVPGEEGKPAYVLNKSVPGYSEIFNTIFPICDRQISYSNVIRVPQQYPFLQAAIDHISENGPNNTTIIVDKNYIYKGLKALTIKAKCQTNNLNGLSLVSCGATIYCAPYYDDKDNDKDAQYAGIYIDGPLTNIKIVGFNIINDNCTASSKSESYTYGILAVGSDNIISNSISFLSVSIKNNVIDLNSCKNTVGISFTDVILGAAGEYSIAADIEDNIIENFSYAGIGFLSNSVTSQTTLLNIVSNTIKSSSPYAYGLYIIFSYIYVCGNKITTTNSIFLNTSKAIILDNTLTSFPEESTSIGIGCINSYTTILIYRNKITGFNKGIDFSNATGNLVSENIFSQNTIDISDLAGPLPGGGVNMSVCNKCSNGKCGGCVTPKNP